MIGILYFIVIVLANTVGAVSGMGGGVIIKPIFDFIGAHDVAAISFYSATAVFTMSVISTTRQLTSGRKFNWEIVSWVSVGAVLGGSFGNLAFEAFFSWFGNKDIVQLIQIALTMGTLIFAFMYTKYNWKNFQFTHVIWYFSCGLILGFLASLLGIGGGPINVSLLMLLFSISIKDATVYSICTILFSQFAKLLTIALTTGFSRYDLTILWFVIPAAIIGDYWGQNSVMFYHQKRLLLFFRVSFFLCYL